MAQTIEETSQTATEAAQSEESKVTPLVEDVPVAASEVPAQESGAGVKSEVVATEATETVSEPKPDLAEEIVAQEPPAAKEKESDIAATTAAAWASWHRVRESGHQDVAAKAVAAGAEDNPNEVSAERNSESGSDPGIASIVDSVLADLRPKIVEEISRKLGKKK